MENVLIVIRGSYNNTEIGGDITSHGILGDVIGLWGLLQEDNYTQDVVIKLSRKNPVTPRQKLIWSDFALENFPRDNFLILKCL